MNPLTNLNVPSPRRKFLRQLIAGSVSGIALPTLGNSFPNSTVIPSPQGGLVDEKYWNQIKDRFNIRPGLIMVNAANLCPSPESVCHAVEQEMELLQTDQSFQFRDRYTERRTETISLLAQYLNAQNAGIGITRNTSESNCTIAMGVKLSRGDEVLLWDQNHPSNHASWKHRAKISGVTIKTFSIQGKTDANSILEIVDNAITPRTRVLAFSHISNTSGVAMPATELCGLARSRSILTLVDGAQSFGFELLDLNTMGCDFFSGSTHKWFMGPLENGILYIRQDSIALVEPLVISAGWKDSALTVQEKYCSMGQRNDPVTAAIPATLEFHRSIGVSTIKSRVVELCTYLKNRVAEKLPSAEIVTPVLPEESAGVVVFRLPGKDPVEVFNKLYRDYHIAAAPSGGVRISPHIYNTLEDMDRVIEAITRIVA